MINQCGIESKNNVFKKEYSHRERLSVFPFFKVLFQYARDESEYSNPANINYKPVQTTPTIILGMWTKGYNDYLNDDDISI